MAVAGKVMVETQREAGKAARRKRILTAAEALLEEVGEAGFTMRELARRAEVSPATPYNLFGTKHGVLLNIYNDDLENFVQVFAAVPSIDGLHRFFDFIHVARLTFEQRPTFYRVMMQAISTHAPADLRTGLMGPRELIYYELTRDAIAQDFLDPSIDPAACARTIAYIMAGALESWVADEISIAQFEDRVGFGVALLLAGACRGRHLAFLQEKIRAYQDTSSDSVLCVGYEDHDKDTCSGTVEANASSGKRDSRCRRG